MSSVCFIATVVSTDMRFNYSSYQICVTCDSRVPLAQDFLPLFSFFLFTVNIVSLMVRTHFHLKVTLIRSTNDEGRELFCAFTDLVEHWIEKYFPLFSYVKDEVSDL